MNPLRPLTEAGRSTLKVMVAAASIVAFSGAAYAAPVFQGRLADGTASTTCTKSGATKCAMYYNTTLDITILNDWSIGRRFWSDTAAAGSAQALAESAGDAQTDFTGWFLPTGDGSAAAGALNQYRSIWNDVGNSRSGLQAQFDGVQSVYYWSGTDFSSARALSFFVNNGSQVNVGTYESLYAVAVRPGDVTASVPEPQTLALTLLALGATVVARRRRSS
jgi:hypothetical protein